MEVGGGVDTSRENVGKKKLFAHFFLATDLAAARVFDPSDLILIIFGGHLLIESIFSRWTRC